MDIHFLHKDLQEECNSFKLLTRHHGSIRAKKIRQRLDDLIAVEILEEMRTLPGRCHELIGDRKGQLSLDLDHPWRLIIIPNDFPPSVKEDGGIDWTQVRSIKVCGIEDTHE